MGARGTPKLKFQSASHTFVGQIYKETIKKCVKQEVYREVEKHLWSQDAVETLLDGPVAKVYGSFVHLQVAPLPEHCRTRLLFKGDFRVAK